ncbi:MAG: LLM class flavin-dependent oxidoreductase [Microbacterium sp.]
MGDLSIGIKAALGADAVRELAPAVEAAGFATLWINETPGTNALEVAAAATVVTRALRVATGVIPLDRRDADAIADEVDRLEIPQDRLTVGIGSGATGQGALALVETSIRTLRGRLNAAIALGALGPKMRQLAATEADAVVLNWLTPEAAAEQSRDLHTINAAHRVVLYARTITDGAARPALEKESSAYASFPKYAANFSRLGFTALDTVIDGTDPAAADLIARYRASVDDLVLRAITPTGSLDEHLAFVTSFSGLD